MPPGTWRLVPSPTMAVSLARRKMSKVPAVLRATLWSGGIRVRGVRRVPGDALDDQRIGRKAPNVHATRMVCTVVDQDVGARWQIAAAACIAQPRDPSPELLVVEPGPLDVVIRIAGAVDHLQQ